MAIPKYLASALGYKVARRISHIYFLRISYYCANEWLPMLSDWDLDAAILSASDPSLQLALVKASQREKVTLEGMIF